MVRGGRRTLRAAAAGDAPRTWKGLACGAPHVHTLPADSRGGTGLMVASSHQRHTQQGPVYALPAHGSFFRGRAGCGGSTREAQAAAGSPGRRGGGISAHHTGSGGGRASEKPSLSLSLSHAHAPSHSLCLSLRTHSSLALSNKGRLREGATRGPRQHRSKQAQSAHTAHSAPAHLSHTSSASSGERRWRGARPRTHTATQAGRRALTPQRASALGPVAADRHAALHHRFGVRFRRLRQAARCVSTTLARRPLGAWGKRPVIKHSAQRSPPSSLPIHAQGKQHRTNTAGRSAHRTAGAPPPAATLRDASSTATPLHHTAPLSFSLSLSLPLSSVSLSASQSLLFALWTHPRTRHQHSRDATIAPPRHMPSKGHHTLLPTRLGERCCSCCCCCCTARAPGRARGPPHALCAAQSKCEGARGEGGGHRHPPLRYPWDCSPWS